MLDAALKAREYVRTVLGGAALEVAEERLRIEWTMHSQYPWHYQKDVGIRYLPQIVEISQSLVLPLAEGKRRIDEAFLEHEIAIGVREHRAAVSRRRAQAPKRRRRSASSHAPRLGFLDSPQEFRLAKKAAGVQLLQRLTHVDLEQWRAAAGPRARPARTP